MAPAMRSTILVLLTLLSACAAQTPKPNEARAGLDQEVTILEAGAEPREQLRYHGSSGRTERLLLRLSLANFLETSAGSAGGATPVLDLVMHIGGTYRGTSEGLWGYPLKFELIGVNGADGMDPAALDALAKELEPIARTNGVFEIDNRGITRSAEVIVPPEASPRLLAMLSNVRTTLLAAALPREAVGIGARWEADRIVTVGGMKVPQTVTYTLLAREVDVLRIGISMRQSAKPQEFTRLDGTVVQLESYEMNAVGTTVVDLHGFAPLSEVRAQSQLRATMRRGGLAEPVALNGELNILIAPLPDAAKPQDDAPAPAPDASAAPAAPPT
jgi:hypothetical protein